MGADRSLVRVGRELGKSRQHHIERWSRRFDWVQRVKAWDDDLQERRRAKFVTEKLEMDSRHATISCLFQEKVITRLQEMSPEELKEMTPTELISWFTRSVEVERVSRGLPPQIVKPSKKADEEEGDGPQEPVQFTETIISTRQEFAEFKANLRPDQRLLVAP